MNDKVSAVPATCDLGDVHKSATDGAFRVLPPVFRDFGRRLAFHGPVSTVRCFEDNSMVKAAVESLGRIDLWKVRMKPGKPLAFGYVANTPFIGLPGNPVSGFATFALFARPFLLKSMGAHVAALRPLRLPAAFGTTRTSDRRDFARGRITAEQGIELYANQGSGVLSSLSWADALVELPENTLIHPGDLVNVHLLSELLA